MTNVASALPLRVDCPFCQLTHVSPFIDELEEQVMACRAAAHPDKRGTLEAWGDQNTIPVRVDMDDWFQMARGN